MPMIYFEWHVHTSTSSTIQIEEETFYGTTEGILLRGVPEKKGKRNSERQTFNSLVYVDFDENPSETFSLHVVGL